MFIFAIYNFSRDKVVQTELKPKVTLHRVSTQGVDSQTLEILARHSLLDISNPCICCGEIEKNRDRFVASVVEEGTEVDHDDLYRS